MNKYFWSFLVVGIALSFALVVRAQTEPTSALEETLPEAGLTPASPLHVFERFGDWVRLNVLTLNSVRKAEIKIEIAGKRAAELKAVVEAGESGNVIERAEGFVRVRAEEIEGDIERLDSEGRNIDSLIEKFNDLSLKRQAVLEDVLERAPEQAKAAVLRAIENSQKGLEKAEEVLKKQVEKGLIKEEKAKEIFERTVLRLKSQVEKRSERLDELAEELGEVPPEVSERFEAKLKHLEDRLIHVESREELKEVREELKDQIKDAASTVLELRKRHKFSDDVGDELLRDIERDRFDVAQKAAEAVLEAEKEIAEIKVKIARAESAGKATPQNVRELINNAEKHLVNAKSAFENKNFGEAFGQANAARSNAKSAKRFWEQILEEKDKAQKIIEEAEEKVLKREEKKIDKVLRMEIIMTDEGFSPKEVRINKGGTVVWTNKSAKAMWPASAVHPTHSVYPEGGGCIGSAFDACKRIEIGGTYEFQFNQVGSWRYHDHLNTSFFGLIEVKE